MEINSQTLNSDPDGINQEAGGFVNHGEPEMHSNIESTSDIDGDVQSASSVADDKKPDGEGAADEGTDEVAGSSSPAGEGSDL